MEEDVKVPIRLASIHFCENIREFHPSRPPRPTQAFTQKT